MEMLLGDASALPQPRYQHDAGKEQKGGGRKRDPAIVPDQLAEGEEGDVPGRVAGGRAVDHEPPRKGGDDPAQEQHTPNHH